MVGFSQATPFAISTSFGLSSWVAAPVRLTTSWIRTWLIIGKAQHSKIDLFGPHLRVYSGSFSFATDYKLRKIQRHKLQCII